MTERTKRLVAGAIQVLDKVLAYLYIALLIGLIVYTIVRI